MIYLIKNGNLFKVGYTQNIDKRMLAYSTTNPEAELIDYVITYQKTGRQLETVIHSEIKAMGFNFIRSKITGSVTEWFRVPRNQVKSFAENGLKNFKACKNRKVIE